MRSQWTRIPFGKIAVVSDTHDKVPDLLLPSLAEADAIWHLGDVTGTDILDRFKALGKPLLVVRGNCDPAGCGWPWSLDLKAGNTKIRLIHIPPTDASFSFGGRPDLLLHGHTHVPRDEVVAGIRFLNPGCITRPRADIRSFAWLELAEGQEPKWRMQVLK